MSTRVSRTGATRLFAWPVILGILFTGPVLAEEGGAGKETFMAKQCNLCHGIAAEGIEATTKVEKLKGPNLDGVGDRHDGPWMTAYIKREQVGENGKKHTKPFKGTDEELQAIVDWLSELKAEGE